MIVKWGIAVNITTISLAACNCIPTVLPWVYTCGYDSIEIMCS